MIIQSFFSICLLLDTFSQHMPHEAHFKAVNGATPAAKPSDALLYFSHYMEFALGVVKRRKGAAGFWDEISLSSSRSHRFTADDKLEASSAVRERRHRVQPPRSVNTDLTFCTKPPVEPA